MLKKLKRSTGTVKKTRKIIYEQNENISKDTNYEKEVNKFLSRKIQ